MGAAFDQVCSRNSGWWGEPEEIYGKHHYAKGLRWATGAQVWFTPSDAGGPNAGRFTSELPGSVLAEWTGAERVAEMSRLLDLGVCPRRVDLALDLYGSSPTLIREIKAACDREELCHVTKVKHIVDTCRGVVTGESLYLGSRSSHGRYVVIYDKGLEQRFKADGSRWKRGEWLRWEARFHEQAAVEACLALRKAAAGGGDMRESDGVEHVAASSWEDEALGLILGVVDFREPRRGKNRSLKRRKVAAWWASFCGEVRRVRLRGCRTRTPSLQGFKRAFQRCYWRSILGLGAATGQDVGEVLGYLVSDDLRPGGRPGVIAEYVRVCRKERAA